MTAVLKKRALAEYSQTLQEPSYHIPTKKLKLVKKDAIKSGTSALALISCLESCKTSNETLITLLRVSDSFEFEPQDLPEAVKKLSEHFKNESESPVRVKILSLLSDIGHEPGADVVSIIEETLSLLKNDRSHKVIAQGMNTVLKLGKLVTDNVGVHSKLVEVAKNYLKDVSHYVKCKCLEIIAQYTPITTDEDAKSTLQLICLYCNNDDARVRSQAFSAIIILHERGFKLNPDIYTDVCEALKDDYEIVRKVALQLLWHIANTFPENVIVLPDSEQELRLIDDAFGKICNGVTDLSMHVRTHAVKLLGSMNLVNPKFLNQTLDKKLMSNMRRKRTAHELAWENVTSGEWASGKKWADDAPRELIDADSISLMSSGACGAFVHGLEDEFLEVRSASVEALCQLALNNPEFANLSLDFLVDMFNDEIEDVRLKAIDSLRCISEHITLRDDQLETILGALEDFSQEVREGLHLMLASCRLATQAGLKMCVDKLLDNLKKYPQDKRSTFRCLQRVGGQHPELVLTLVPQLLNIHPFFDTAEPDVDNPQYICILILVLNAAKHSPTIVPLFEPHTLRHFAYLRDTLPGLVPELRLPGSHTHTISTPMMAVPESFEFLRTVISNLDLSGDSYRMQEHLFETAREHLSRLSEMDATVAGTAQFTALYIGGQMLLAKILEKGQWASPAALPTQQANILKTHIQQLLEHCLKLQHFFVGLGPVERAAVKQFHLRVLGLNLVYIVRGSNASALYPCHVFLSAVEDVQKELLGSDLEPDGFSAAVFSELAALEEPKPGTVARILLPLLVDAKPCKIPEPNSNIQMSSAVILEPSGQTDSTLKFTAGLIMSVPFEAEIRNLANPNRLRLKVKYPDQRTQIILPRPAHMKPLLHSDGASGESRAGENVRLLTNVLISHQVWSEACNVEINLALAVPEADVVKRKACTDMNPTLLELCKPVKVSVAPKPIKKTL